MLPRRLLQELKDCRDHLTRKTKFQIRPIQVIHWLLFLRESNPLYCNIQLEFNALETLRQKIREELVTTVQFVGESDGILLEEKLRSDKLVPDQNNNSIDETSEPVFELQYVQSVYWGRAL